MKSMIALTLALCFLPFGGAEAQEPSPALVKAIAKQESGLNPQAVNVAGKSYYPATREEAKRLIREAIAAGKSFDVGMMQINSWWIDRYSISAEQLLDPVFNAEWGKKILTEEISRNGLNWQAVGKYHSPDSERGRRYAWLVYYHYAGRGASNSQKEAPHAQHETSSQDLSDSGRVRADQDVSQQGGAVPVHVQQKGVPWVFRPKSGAAGGKD